ncbi:hypothetical protein [Methylocucumis oryzae]|uniref:Uncharacterized protein n=1 Tax=Methylocucumis oryzae TaxID=1632867 RepID=A0A0F3IN93_9GAMM|nr:hypothetical protein [Methylocucumis oryzae]KJV08028.1 hypothetical protein VZ94_01065 [Methylocucumis oryzae]
MRDLTLVSKRVYGNRDESLAVMASAGLNHIDQELKQGRMVLPNSTTLYQLKRQSGFESVAELRENFKPVWAE